MIRVGIIGQGLVALHFAVGLERLKRNEITDHGVPLRNLLPYGYNDIEIVASYDVDESKVGKSIYELARREFSEDIIPGTLKDIYVSRGIHLGSMKNLPFKARGREEEKGLSTALNELIDEWHSYGIDVLINVITTEPAEPIDKPYSKDTPVSVDSFTASQAYAYAAAVYSGKYRRAAFLNCIPTPLANDPYFVGLYKENGGVILGDDGATGATPLTADLLEHLYERNRKVLGIAQFNIGGNTDFLALNLPERNIMKKRTKSSMIKDILGYEAPNYIRPTGYLEPLGDKKFVAMIIEYMSFGEFKDEIYVIARINDSPALAGLLVDLVRLGKIALDRGVAGTVYEINAFYMKKPGPKGSKTLSKFHAYQNLLKWLGITDKRLST